MRIILSILEEEWYVLYGMYLTIPYYFRVLWGQIKYEAGHAPFSCGCTWGAASATSVRTIPYSPTLWLLCREGETWTWLRAIASEESLLNIHILLSPSKLVAINIFIYPSFHRQIGLNPKTQVFFRSSRALFAFGNGHPLASEEPRHCC